MARQLIIAGIDEVGRGCLIGCVMAAAVILKPHDEISGLTDSKKLTPKQRQILAGQIKLRSAAWSIGRAEAGEIDTINILQASLLAMCRAYASLSVTPERVLVDGKHFPNLSCPGEAVVKGDRLIPEIAAASILAKVARDEEMLTLNTFFPGYAIDRHKGYPTQRHVECMQQLGNTPLHRMTFAPVKKIFPAPSVEVL